MNRYKFRYILTIAILLAAWIAGGEVMAQVHIHGNVYGGGKGKGDSFECKKAMVGLNDAGEGKENPGTDATYKDYGTKVTINSGTVDQNVYGGGMVGRVEWNTQVTIGSSLATTGPVIGGSVFGAGKGLATHGYSALVRGDCTVTIQNHAKVGQNVYGGGEKATAGRYKVAKKTDLTDEFRAAHPGIEAGMPYETKTGGKCTVIVKEYAQIGPDGASATATETAGHVFGAGQGINPSTSAGSYKYGSGTSDTWSRRMVEYNSTTHATGEHVLWDYYPDDHNFVWEYFETKEKYNNFLQTLALVTNTSVTINGDASVTSVKGSVYGGSENGFVQDDTNVAVQNGKIGTDGSYGNVFGGGKGVTVFAEAGKVKGNTKVTISGGTMYGSVYGGGELGDVGKINKADIRNYSWVANTGKCEVEITGTGAIVSGNVFGAGKGEAEPTTFWCEKAMVNNTEVSISNGTVNHNVYGGGEKGRVEHDTKVTIGPATGTCSLDIKGSVFGAGMGVVTHGYSALVRGNTEVTVQSNAVVEKSVYGGGEIASVGKYGLDAKGMPSQLIDGGDCVVTVKGAAQIGTNGGGNVFGGGQGVNPDLTYKYDTSDLGTSSKRMMTYNSSYKDTDKPLKWDYTDDTHYYVWEYFPSRDQYLTYLETLALATDPEVTIGTASGTQQPAINGSVFGGGERGIVKGEVDVEIVGGTIEEDVYGGGSLADTNTGNWQPNKSFVEVTTLQAGHSYYKDEDVYTIITDMNAKAVATTTYYEKNEGTYEEATVDVNDPVTGKYTKSVAKTAVTYAYASANSGTYYESQGGWADASGTAWKTTTVNLLGGLVKGDAYGGGLGQKAGFNNASSDIPAVVWGNISVNLGSNGGSTATAFDITKYTGAHSGVVKSGRVFGCNNLSGSPQGNVTVTVWKTVSLNADGTVKGKPTPKNNTTYELAAVYGGGNLANFTTTGKKASVIIETCNVSVKSVYGGGNAADVPETDVLVKGAYEIGEVFGGGNGEDSYTTDGGTSWTPNPGADVNGNATTLLKGGYIHEAYGGSNTKGTISGNVSINKSSGGDCTLQVDDLYGAGKNADVEGDLIVVLGCSETRTENVYGCSMNANVKGNVELTITSGEYGKVFGGNNQSGSIFGHIVVNIEEIGCSPIIIDELYGCGNDAPYSVYGYYQAHKYVKTETGELFLDAGMTIPLYKEGDNLYKDAGKTKLLYEDATTHLLYVNEEKTRALYMPRTSANDLNTAFTFTGKPHTNPPYADPEVNIISCTRIGKVFGGGYGENAIVYGNPKVNINMIKGVWAGNTYGSGSSAFTPPNKLGKVGDGYSYIDETENKTVQVEGGVFGGGNQAPVYGNTNLNIGTETDVYVVKTNITAGTTNVNGYYTRSDAGTYTQISDNTAIAEEGVYYYEKKTVLGANITSNVYGGGNLADVGKTKLEKDNNNKDVDVVYIEGSTFVNIGAVKGEEITEQGKGTGRYNYTSVSFTAANAPGITIGGNVYGGGKGEAKESGDGAFRCSKAMVTKHTNVAVGNGTIGDGAADHGHVYGGGEKGRVQENTTVTIGCENDANSAPVITGNVFGAGKGVNTHGYSALARGNSYVTVQGEAKVKKSVYGGGEIASVGKYNVAQTTAEAQEHGVDVGMPYSLANQNSGYCTVIVRDNAVIGPDEAMIMTRTGYPDDMGHVFGGGKGVLPYEGYADNAKAWRVKIDNKKQEYLSKNEAITGTDESGYLTYVETLGLATQTYVTIDENAFVKGSVYGGSENGYVQHDTQVNIRGNCQIGNGYVQMADDGTYLATKFGVNRRYTAKEWEEGHLFVDGDTEVDASSEAETALRAAVSTNYSSSLPECASWPYGQATGDDKYAPWDKYYGTANYDSKGGRTTADDGHTFYGNVFGGGSGVIPYRPGKWHPKAGSVAENTVVNVTGGHILTNIYGGNELTDVYGKCTVNFGGTATLGVPRTLKQIGAHPLTCYLFGAGKGDQRVLFNKSTNVREVEVNITGGWIYGSVFGGGEDGHVHHNVTMTINEADYAADNTKTRTKIGTWGTSYVEGNVFGGGRGFGADAYTAGNVAGTVTMTIESGTILGSIYGGGRLGSVGYGLFDAETNGEPTPGYGEMRPDNTSEDSNPTPATNFKRGYVYMTIGNDNGTGPTIGNTHEYIVPNTDSSTGNTPSSITETDFKKWSAADWTAWKNHNHVPNTEYDTTTGRLTHTKGGNVFAGGMGRLYQLDGISPISAVDWWKLGNVKSTTLTIKGGTIKSNVYGGGELGMVQGGTHTSADNKTVSTEIAISGGTIGTVIQESVTVPGANEGDPPTTELQPRYTFGSVFGGGYGSLTEELNHTGSTNPTYTNASYYRTYPKYIAGRVKGSIEVTMTGGEVMASVYGGGEMAAVGESTVLANPGDDDPKVLGETLTGNSEAPVEANTYVTIGGGIIGKDKVGMTYFGGATMGNVYGGGSGHNNTVRSGHVYGNTNVTINSGTIFHNVYGGGAYGTVGDFTYLLGNDATSGTKKVVGINGLHTDRSGTGTATVTITGGTIGVDGHENGMVFGSSRGDINEPGKRDDYTAWVNKANVTIGTEGQGATLTSPLVKGSVYGSGENGHTYNNTVVTVNSGTIGVTTGEAVGGLSGAAYSYRGNVYGGGCGTDKYYSNHAEETHDGNGQLFNPLAGIVYGTTTVNINGGLVARNVYGAGAMGSVGRTVTTTTTEGETTTTTTTITGGTTTINVSGGRIGVDGTVGDGNVFGAARGNADAVSNEAALVRKETTVSVTGGIVKGNVYGGGELGCVGEYTISSDYRTFTWQDTDGVTNTDNNTKNTGICNVEIDGSSAVINGNVFGAGKGKEDTFWCEKGIAYSTNVSIKNGTVNGNVYGGGEVGRVETDTQVKIGDGDGTVGGAIAPTITGSVFGGGAGVETHGYSALVRGNTTVTVEGNAGIGHSVYGGGEIASVGRYALDAQKMPSILQGGGYCYVTVKGHAAIGDDVFGAGKGVTPHFDKDNADPSKRSRRMTLKSDWESRVGADRFDWNYLTSEDDYSTYLETLALATHPEVTIDGSAAVSGSVFGGGELGLTKGSVIVNIQGGTITEDVYGGGSLANTNTTSSVDTDGDGVEDKTVHPTTTVNLKGGIVTRNVYGGGLGRLAAGPKAAVYYTAEEATDYNTAHELSSGDEGYVSEGDVKTPAQAAVTAVEAKVYGDVTVKLNEPETTTTTTGEGENANTTTNTTYGDCEVKGVIFGCNNLNGSPQKNVTVHIYKTVTKTNRTVNDKPTNKDNTTYELEAVYGGGNLAAFYPDDATARASAVANVIIDGCDLTSIKSVYGGGNAASAPATEVTVNGTYEIGEVFGGGNGKAPYQIDGKTYENPGANVGYLSYAYFVKEGETNYSASTHGSGTDADPYKAFEYDSTAGTGKDASTKEDRVANYAYGKGKTQVTIYGGTVHAVYGGSNSKGNVAEAAVALLDGETNQTCEFSVDEAYGGGKNADMDGTATLIMNCITGMKEVYGGAKDADVNSDVTLNITNGTYGQVFGGNNVGGRVSGSITVNIEETGCNPIIIGELYGGGNRAAYSVYGYKPQMNGNTIVTDDSGKIRWLPFESANDDDVTADGVTYSPQTDPTNETDGTKYAHPVINVKSFSSIGTIFGGGYGSTAIMVGDPEVNINVVNSNEADSKYAGDPRTYGRSIDAEGTLTITDETEDHVKTTRTVTYPTHTAGEIGAIGQVFGGGNAAKVIGTPTVNIGTKVGDKIDLVSRPVLSNGDPVYETDIYETDSDGRYVYESDGTTKKKKQKFLQATVVGADIRGNVYGGGNQAEVTGNTNVVIGKETTTTP